MQPHARRRLARWTRAGVAWGAATLLLGVGACSSPSPMDAANRPLAPDESAAVRKKSDEALAKREYALAWNHEVYAGKDRGRLEAIALAALEADAGVAEDMLGQLRKAHGGLSDAGKAKVRALVTAAEGAGTWPRAAEIFVVAADDPPAFKQAWDVYARAPAKDALEILRRIEKARAAFDETAKKPGA